MSEEREIIKLSKEGTSEGVSLQGENLRETQVDEVSKETSEYVVNLTKKKDKQEVVSNTEEKVEIEEGGKSNLETVQMQSQMQNKDMTDWWQRDYTETTAKKNMSSNWNNIDLKSNHAVINTEASVLNATVVGEKVPQVITDEEIVSKFYASAKSKHKEDAILANVKPIFDSFRGEKFRKKVPYIFICLILMTFLFLKISAVRQEREAIIEACTVQQKAQIVGLSVEDDLGKYTYDVAITYTFDLHKYTKEFQIKSKHEYIVKSGDKIELLVNPEEPTVFIVPKFGDALIGLD